MTTWGSPFTTIVHALCGTCLHGIPAGRAAYRLTPRGYRCPPCEQYARQSNPTERNAP